MIGWCIENYSVLFCECEFDTWCNQAGFINFPHLQISLTSLRFFQFIRGHGH